MATSGRSGGGWRAILVQGVAQAWLAEPSWIAAVRDAF
jgi:hypothetical protein